MKEFLKKLLKQKEEKRDQLKQKAKVSDSVEELRSMNSELESLNAEIAELRSEIDKLPDDVPAGGATPPAEGRGQQTPVAGSAGGGVPPVAMASFGVGQQRSNEEQSQDRFASTEYRNAFMHFAKTGEMKQELRDAMAEFRANAMTTVSDVSAVVPTTILNEVISRLKVYGQVFARVRKLNIRGGVEVPILSLKPVATWIGEATSSDKQKTEAKTKVSFSYHGLECKVSISLLADTVTLEGFEAVITDLIVEAMVKAIDMAIIKGDGNGKPTGITTDIRVPAAQVITMTPAEFAEWTQWTKKVFAKMPLAYKAGANFFMASGTFEGYINGMVDDNGQPIGRVNYGITEGPQGRFGGKEVIEVEDDVLPPFDDAATGDVVAVYCNLKNYGFNSNMTLSMFRYFDHDTNEYVDKAILIADGKLIDPNGVVIIKKAAAV